MTGKDFTKVFLLTAICVAAFVGFLYVAMQCPLVGICGMTFFAVYPRIKNACQKKRSKGEP